MKKVFEIANPLLVRHFLFRFPLLSRRKKNIAVNFSLKNSFPYSMEDMQTQWVDDRKRTFAFACRKSIYDSLKKRNVNIISICFLLRKRFSDNIVFCFFNNCLFIQENSGGTALGIRTFRYENLTEEELSPFLKDMEKTVFFKTSDCPPEVTEGFGFMKDKEILPVESLLKKRISKKNILFAPRKFPIAGLISGVLVLALSCTVHFHVMKNWEEKKSAYERCLSEIETLRRNSVKKEQSSAELSIPLILEHISNMDSSLDIKTFRFSSGEVSVDASVSSAGEFASLLKNDELLNSARIENINIKDGLEEVLFSFKVDYEQ